MTLAQGSSLLALLFSLFFASSPSSSSTDLLSAAFLCFLHFASSFVSRPRFTFTITVPVATQSLALATLHRLTSLSLAPSKFVIETVNSSHFTLFPSCDLSFPHNSCSSLLRHHDSVEEFCWFFSQMLFSFSLAREPTNHKWWTVVTL